MVSWKATQNWTASEKEQCSGDLVSALIKPGGLHFKHLFQVLNNSAASYLVQQQRQLLAIVRWMKKCVNPLLEKDKYDSSHPM